MMRVLALNWRDMNHPEAGGAEVHLHEILAHLSGWGHEVVQISSGFPGCSREERIDGVRVIRAGHWYDANFTLPAAALKYLKSNGCDVILEDINKLPFFMPLWTRVPVVAVIPHLFGTTVFREANWAIGAYVVIMERLLPIVFRKNRFMVISPSTADDLETRGIDRDRIDIVLCGLDHCIYRDLHLKRFDRPTIVHLGRLRRYKSVEVVMRAMKKVIKVIPGARLVIIGDGPYRPALEKEASRLDLGDAIEFKGYMEIDDLVEFLNRVHLLFNPSPKEGWGLTVVEANACGVPGVASDRPGLRDSVIDGTTGFLVPFGDSSAFADKAIEILQDERLWKRMSEDSLKRVGGLTWENCARETERLLIESTGGK